MLALEHWDYCFLVYTVHNKVKMDLSVKPYYKLASPHVVYGVHQKTMSVF